jgi:hypothetical protein
MSSCCSESNALQTCTLRQKKKKPAELPIENGISKSLLLLKIQLM